VISEADLFIKENKCVKNGKKMGKREMMRSGLHDPICI
jgi:hypothetical protein